MGRHLHQLACRVELEILLNSAIRHGHTEITVSPLKVILFSHVTFSLDRKFQYAVYGPVPGDTREAVIAMGKQLHQMLSLPPSPLHLSLVSLGCPCDLAKRSWMSWLATVASGADPKALTECDRLQV